MEIDKATAERIEKKMDRLLEMAPIIDALGAILVRHRTAAQRTGIHPNVITRNEKVEKFEEEGHRRVYIEIGDVAVITKNKRRTQLRRK